MKLALLPAGGCLLAALAFALWPAGEAVPFEPETPALELPVAAPAEPAPVAFPGLRLPAARPVEPGDEPLELDDAPYGDEAWLRGRVTPLSGAQPGVRVTFQGLCGADCSPSLLEADTDPITGEFALALPPGTYQVVARADGFLPATEEGLTVSAAEHLADLVMTLERGERITGSVHRGGQPTAGAQVAAIASGWIRTALTDELGRFEISGLPRGSYTVRAYSGAYGGDEQQVAAGGSVSFELGYRQKVVGRVLDARGFPAEGVAIFSDYQPLDVLDTDPYVGSSAAVLGLGMHGCGPSPQCYQRAVTGPDGRFEVETSVGQTLTLGARRGNAYALLDEVTPGEPVTLTLADGVEVQVVDEAGKPLAGAQLQVEPQSPFFGQPAPSDELGFVTLRGGGYRLVRSEPGTRVLGDVPTIPWSVSALIKEPLVPDEIIY